MCNFSKEIYDDQLIGFPFFESQAKWIAQLLSGKRTLPSWDEMMNSIQEFYNSRDIAGIPKHNTHDIANFEVNFYLPFYFCRNTAETQISPNKFCQCIMSVLR